MISGQPYARATAAHLIVIWAAAGALACGGGTSVTELGGPDVRCQVTLAANPRVVPPDGGTATVTVDAARDCTWTAGTDASWATLGTSSGQGAGSIAVTVVATQSATVRTAAINVNNQRVDLSQEGRPCRFTLSPSAAEIGAPGGSISVAVTTLEGCAWRAVPGAPWIAAPGTARTGSGSVALDVTVNAGPQRDAVVTIGDQPFTITQHAAGSPGPVPPTCIPVVQPAALDVPASAATEMVRLEVAAGCAWTAASQAAWLAIASDAAGIGAASIRVAIAQNTGAARTGTMTVAGQPVTVNQAAPTPAPPPPCAYTIGPASRDFQSGGGEGRIQIATRDDCGWSAASNANWVTITVARGTGGGEARYRVQANATPQAREATVTIQGRSHRVRQAGLQPCTFSLAPSSVTIPAAGGAGKFSVTTRADCAWTARTDAPWITITAGSGTGPGEVLYTGLAHQATDTRSATITIGDQTHTVTQSAAAPPCSYTLTPGAQAIPAAGGESRFTVNAPSGCTWSTSGGADWITVATPSGSGTGEVVYTVQTNPAQQPRSAIILVAGQSHAVTQAAAACTYSVTPVSQTIPAAGGEGRFTVTTQGGCSWSTSGGAGWLTIANPSGSGTADVVYTVQLNPAEARSATIVVAGQAHTVNQLAGTPTCAYSLNPSSQNLPAAGGDGRFAVVTQGGCTWSTSGGAPWMTIVTAGGSGPGDVLFSLQANQAPDPRSATIFVAGQPHTITQAAAVVCTYALNPSTSLAPAAGGEGRFTVTTQPGCPWSAAPGVDWIAIVAAGGSGPGDVVYNVQPNMTPSERLGTVSVAGQSHTVTQPAGSSSPAPPSPAPQP